MKWPTSNESRRHSGDAECKISQRNQVLQLRNFKRMITLKMMSPCKQSG